MNCCGYCGAVFEGGYCSSCATEHEKAKRFMPGQGLGRKVPALTLDQQEGNAEEYFGGLDFPVKGYRE